MRKTRRSAMRSPDLGARDERFARAVDGGVRDLSDPEQERELAVVAALRRAGAAAGPRPDETARMRRRVLTVTHRDDGRTPDVAMRPARRAGGARHRRRRIGTRGRVLVAAASVCLLVALAGMSVLLSRNAVPGDTLYAFKRTAESAEMGLTFGARDRALKHLEFAQTRVSEVARMAVQPAPATDEGAGRVDATLDDFDADVTSAMRLLATQAAGDDGGHDGGHDGGDRSAHDVLASLSTWAQQQQQRLRAIADALPQRVTSRLAESLRLLERVQQRAAALVRRSECPVLTAGAGDQLGPIPATRPCGPPSGAASLASPLPDRRGDDGDAQQDRADTSTRASGPEQSPTGDRSPSQQPPATGSDDGQTQPLRDLADRLSLPEIPDSDQRGDSSESATQSPDAGSDDDGLTIPLLPWLELSIPLGGGDDSGVAIP